MSCHQLPELCPDYHAGALSAQQAARYEQHLRECAECRLADAEYGEGLALLQPLPEEVSERSDEQFLADLLASGECPLHISADARQGFLAETLHPQDLVGALHATPLPARRSPLRWLPLALAASILLALSALLWQRGQPQPERAEAELALDDETLFAEADLLAWVEELPRLEESLLEGQAELALGEVLPEGPEQDPEALEEELWAELALEDEALEEPWPEPEPGLQEALEALSPEQLEHLKELVEQG
jgi:hypothetical protein